MKTAITILLAASSIILFLLNGCKTSDNPAQPDTSKNFTFVKVGNKWIYASTNQSQTLPDATMEVTQSMGNNVYKIISTFPGSTFGSVMTFWYQNGETLSLNCDSAGTHIDFVMNSSIRLNTVYSSVVYYNPWVNPGDTVYLKITSFDTLITVPAGSFNCAKIYTWGPATSQMPMTESLISRTSGIIRQSNQFMTIELKSKNF